MEATTFVGLDVHKRMPRWPSPSLAAQRSALPGRDPERGWTRAYRRWLTMVRFDHPAQQIVLLDYIHAVEDAEARLARLEQQIEELLPSWSMAPVVEALQAMRGIALIVATTVSSRHQVIAPLSAIPALPKSRQDKRPGEVALDAVYRACP
jgi:transposase